MQTAGLVRPLTAWLLLTAFIGAPAGLAGEPEPEPAPTIGEAAEAALAAWRADDAAALAAAGARGLPDPWLVADALLARGETEAALAFSRAAPRKAVASLPAYVAAHEEGPGTVRMRAAIEELNRALLDGGGKAALDVVDRTPFTTDVVPGVRLRFGRGLALRGLGRDGECAADFLAAGEAAHRLGWFARALSAFHEAAVSATAAEAWPLARDVYAAQRETALEIDDPGTAASALANSGAVLSNLGEFEEAGAILREALAECQLVGDDAMAFAAVNNLVRVAVNSGNLEGARTARAERVHQMADSPPTLEHAWDLLELGLLQLQLHEQDPAEETLARLVDVARGMGARALLLRSLGELVNLRATRGDEFLEEDAYLELVALAHETANSALEADGLRVLSIVQERRGKVDVALDTITEALPLLGHLSDAGIVLRVLHRAADLEKQAGQLERSLELTRHGVDEMARLADVQREIEAWSALVRAQTNAGRLHDGLQSAQRMLEVAHQAGRPAGEFMALGDLTLLSYDMARTGPALEYAARARALAVSMPEGQAPPPGLAALGQVLFALGRHAEGLAYLDEAIRTARREKDVAVELESISSQADLYILMGAYEQAVRSYQRVLRDAAILGDQEKVARAMGGIGVAKELLGDHVWATRSLRGGLAIVDRLGNRLGSELGLGLLALAELRGGNVKQAYAAQARLLRMKREDGVDPKASELVFMALLEDRSGEGPTAEDHLAAARDAQETRGLQADWERILVLGCEAGIRLRHDQAAEALQVAARVRALLPTTGEDLALSQAAYVRRIYAGAFSIGTWAAMRMGDVKEAFAFLESGRAGALLQALGSRQAVLSFTVPEALREIHEQAEERVRTARASLQAARTGDRLEEVKHWRDEYAQAQDALQAVFARLEHASRGVVGLSRPTVRPLDEIQRQLAPGETLLVYGMGNEEVRDLLDLPDDRAVAVVLDRTSARMVRLAPVTEIVAAADALELETSGDGYAPALEELRRMLVDPLGLPPSDRTILVAAEGALLRVPLSLLFAHRPVAMVPSASVLTFLREETRSARGRDVLAVGRPAYERGDSALAGLYGRPQLWTDLPETQKEARSIGDVVLLGTEATESGLLAALSKRSRWRALHLACHGFQDPDLPAMSGVALTPEGDDDGMLTCMEVFRARIPADLVVLSACETGRGRIVGGEGLLGLPHAFLFAGARSVIASLWRVDDAATRELMETLYALWNPKDGSKGLPLGEALRRAQEHVRTLEREVVDEAASRAAGHEVRRRERPWEHPRYWAAWVLWGLPD